MITRRLFDQLNEALHDFPVVGLLGPRQVGKTTLAAAVADAMGPERTRYLDLESPAARARLLDPEAYLEAQRGRLVILDEIHRMPELFATLRVIVDRRRRQGARAGQFLVLGSASLDLLRQSSESLAGRIRYLELTPLRVDEIEPTPQALDRLWVRGGFPDSLLARGDAASLAWRRSFIRTYLERDIPQLGPRIPAETLRRLWTMLAHTQGQPLNAARMAAGLGVTGVTVGRYLDLLVDLLLVRRVEAWSGNVGKRLVRAPRVYVRDSGLVHALLGLEDREAILGHPVAGLSWEGLIVENLAAAAGDAPIGFYRTSGGAELDLVIDGRRRRRYAVEIKRSSAPELGKGFWNARDDVGAAESIVVYPGEETIPLGSGVLAMGPRQAMTWVAERTAR